MPVEGRWVERVIGIGGTRQEVAVLRIPGAPCGIELSRFTTPPAVRSEPDDAPPDTLGTRRVTFAVDEVEDTVTRLRRHGAELVGGFVQYEDVHLLCYVRGPEGIVVGLAEELH